MTNELKECINKQLFIVDNILFRYTRDEAGENQYTKYKEMTRDNKISLLTYTLLNCSSWEDFETDLIINFDYNNY